MNTNIYEVNDILHDLPSVEATKEGCMYNKLLISDNHKKIYSFNPRGRSH